MRWKALAAAAIGLLGLLGIAYAQTPVTVCNPPNSVNSPFTTGCGGNTSSVAFPTSWGYPGANGEQWSDAGSTITTATTTQMFAAAGAGLRNYLAGIQFTNSGSTGVTLQILDGSTIIWDGFLGTSTGSPNPLNIQFAVPLKGSVNTSMSVKTLTGSGFTVNGNAQGFTGQ